MIVLWILALMFSWNMLRLIIASSAAIYHRPTLSLDSYKFVKSKILSFLSFEYRLYREQTA